MLTRSIGDLAARADAAKDLEARLTSGQVIVELDTALIDPSFIADRMSHNDEAYSALRAAMMVRTRLGSYPACLRLRAVARDHPMLVGYGRGAARGLFPSSPLPAPRAGSENRGSAL